MNAKNIDLRRQTGISLPKTGCGKLYMDENTIKSVEFILSRGDRAELIPVNGGVKVMRVRREEVRTKENRPG